MTDRYKLEIRGPDGVVFEAKFNLGDGYMAGFETMPIPFVTSFIIEPIKEEADND